MSSTPIACALLEGDRRLGPCSVERIEQLTGEGVLTRKWPGRPTASRGMPAPGDGKEHDGKRDRHPETPLQHGVEVRDQPGCDSRADHPESRDGRRQDPKPLDRACLDGIGPTIEFGETTFDIDGGTGLRSGQMQRRFIQPNTGRCLEELVQSRALAHETGTVSMWATSTVRVCTRISVRAVPSALRIVEGERPP